MYTEGKGWIYCGQEWIYTKVTMYRYQVTDNKMSRKQIRYGKKCTMGKRVNR
jgi:hypothetical protein